MRCTTCSDPLPQLARFCPGCGALADAADRPTRTVLSPGEPQAGLSASMPRISYSVGGVLATAAADGRFVPGTLLAARYRIIGLVGSGGMGEVYRADDLTLGQAVALKFLPRAMEADPDRLGRFLNEVRIARSISHPNVCRVYDVGEVDGQPFLSMEYVDGEDLASLLRRIGRLSPDKVLQIARQLCAGVAAAHQKGILHRDLKPSNVMIDGRGQVRITDFGLAGAAEQIRGAELYAGTPDYMSPEQLEGREVSQRSDVYALGHILYEMVSGRRAFRTGSITELARMQRQEVPASPLEVVPDLDPAIERVILRCLEKEPRDRPASALAVAAGLPGSDPLAAALAAGETPSPEMVAAAGPRGGLSSRAALACLVLLTAGIVISGWSGDPGALHGYVAFDKPRDALAYEARRIVEGLGWNERPSDWHSQFVVNEEELAALARENLTPSRWDALARPEQQALGFFYRRGQRLLIPSNAGGIVTADDPVMSAGDVRVQLDLQGRLQRLLAVPPRASHDPGPASPPDWSKLFGAAGLDPTRFTSAAPTMQPPVYSDARAAWSGSTPSGEAIRIEAAAAGGLPVYFEILTPRSPQWSAATVTETAPQSSPAGGTVLLVFFLLLIVSAAFLAARNWRQGRGDRRGALRLAGFVLLARMALWATTSHHVGSLEGELTLASRAAATGLLMTALWWIGYIALEPYARRLWPQALVSWNRLLAGRLSDPLVGRDLLIGFATGCGLQMLGLAAFRASIWAGVSPGLLNAIPIRTLNGGRYALGGVCQLVLSSLFGPLLLFMLFLVLRLLLRRAWAACAAFALVYGVLGLAEVWGPASSPALYAITFGTTVLAGAVMVGVLVRYGLLVLAGCLIYSYLSGFIFPTRLDPDAPYFPISLLAISLAVGLALYAFRTALAGRALFRDAVLGEQSG